MAQQFVQDSVLGPMDCLDRMIVILFTGSIWTGERTLRKGDLNINEDDLPPEAIARLGSKDVFNTEKLRVFHTLKKTAERRCLEVGIRFLGGYAVPYDEAIKLAPELNDIEAQFNVERDSLLRAYDKDLVDFIRKYPKWEAMIRNSALTKAEVQSRLSFEWVPTKIGAPDAADGSDLSAVLSKSLQSKAKGLAATLYSEIAKAASDIDERQLKDRQKVDQRFVSSIERIRTKLTSLSFLDVRVKPLIETINHVVNELPKAGAIEGLGLAALQGLLFILSDEERMQAHAERIQNGKSVKAAFSSSAPVFRSAQQQAHQEEQAAKVVAVKAESVAAPVVGAASTTGESDLFGQSQQAQTAAETVVVEAPAPVVTKAPVTPAKVEVVRVVPPTVSVPKIVKAPRAQLNFGALKSAA